MSEISNIPGSWREFYIGKSEVFLGDISQEHVDEVITDLITAENNNDQIALTISSGGGDTNAGFKLAQFIEQELKKPVVARVWGECSSAATYALLCCERRIAHPQAVFVIHRQTSGIELEYTESFNRKLIEWKKENKATHQRQIDFYARKLNTTKKKVEKILLHGMGLDRDMSAKKAKKIGLITEIATP